MVRFRYRLRKSLNPFKLFLQEINLKDQLVILQLNLINKSILLLKFLYMLVHLNIEIYKLGLIDNELLLFVFFKLKAFFSFLL